MAKPRLGGLVPPLPVAVPAAPAWPSLCISGPKPASVPDRFSFPYAGPRPVLLAYEHEEGPMTDEIWACPPRGQPRVPSPSRPEFTEQTSELRTFRTSLRSGNSFENLRRCPFGPDIWQVQIARVPRARLRGGEDEIP